MAVSLGVTALRSILFLGGKRPVQGLHANIFGIFCLLFSALVAIDCKKSLLDYLEKLWTVSTEYNVIKAQVCPFFIIEGGIAELMTRC